MRMWIPTAVLGCLCLVRVAAISRQIFPLGNDGLKPGAPADPTLGESPSRAICNNEHAERLAAGDFAYIPL